MKTKLKFKLNCDEETAAARIADASHPYVEKDSHSDRVRFYLMREHKGLRYVEYIFDGELASGELVGDMTSPRILGDRPSPAKAIILGLLSLCVFAAVFGVIYLFVHIFARNFWLSLYIALPVFGVLFGGLGLIAFLLRRKKKQLNNLKDFLGDIVVNDKK